MPGAWKFKTHVVGCKQYSPGGGGGFCRFLSRPDPHRARKSAGPQPSIHCEPQVCMEVASISAEPVAVWRTCSAALDCLLRVAD